MIGVGPPAVAARDGSDPVGAQAAIQWAPTNIESVPHRRMIRSPSPNDES